MLGINNGKKKEIESLRKEYEKMMGILFRKDEIAKNIGVDINERKDIYVLDIKEAAMYEFGDVKLGIKRRYDSTTQLGELLVFYRINDIRIYNRVNIGYNSYDVKEMILLKSEDEKERIWIYVKRNGDIYYAGRPSKDVRYKASLIIRIEDTGYIKVYYNQ